jgi:ethanolamine kinase
MNLLVRNIFFAVLCDLFPAKGLSTVDYSLYPDLDFQRTWIKMYLVEFNGTSEVSENEVHQLLLLVNKFSLASHFLWTTWALVQAEHSTIDFDYLE